MFLKLTLVKDKVDVLINMDHVKGIEPVSGGCIIITSYTDSGPKGVKVMESFNEIEWMVTSG